MAFKFMILAILMASASAGVLPNYHAYQATPEASYSYSAAEGHAGVTSTAFASYKAPVYEEAVYAAPAPKYAAPVVYLAQAKDEEHYEPSAPANYEFGYAVKDPHTGDSKSQKESRKGDTVHGSYSVVDPDGTKRTVEYTADDHHGFQAVVHKEPLYQKVIATPNVYAEDKYYH